MAKIGEIKEDKITSRRLSWFSWDKVPGEDSGRLKGYLNRNFRSTYWAKAKIERVDDKTIKVSTEINSLSLRLNDEKTEVVLTIDDGRTDKLIAKTENGTLNIYQKKKRGRPERELRTFVGMKMVKLESGSWKNPFSSKQKEYKTCSKAVDAAMKYFLSERDGEERRAKELGEDWRYIW